MPAASTRRIEVAPGQHIVADFVAGNAPAWVYLHGLASVRVGEKSTAVLRHAETTGRAAARFDARGHGESSGRLGHATVGEYIEDTLTLLECTGPAVLIGSSLGGLVAAHVASRAPELVRGLCLMAPAFGFLPRLEQRLDAQRRLVTAEGVLFELDQRVLDDARSLPEQDLAEHIAAPTLIVHGRLDDVVPWQLSERFFRELAAPCKDLWLVDDGCHRLHREIDGTLARLDALLQSDRRPR
jgi:pimeloyl-ACP methyl ester carboxylesterase